MITHIQDTNLEHFIKKASIYTTGGGLDVKRQIASLHSIRSELNVELKTPDEFSDSQYACSVTEIGSLSAPPLDKKNITIMIQLLKQISGKKIAGFFPPEVGQESIIIESSHYSNLPIVDFDPVGFRAVPFVDINIFCLKPNVQNFGPAVVMTDKGEFISINTPISYQRAETILRNITELSEHGCIFVLGEITEMSKIKKLSKTNNMTYHSMLEQKVLDNNVLFQDEFIVLNKKEVKNTGFTGEIITIQSKKNQQKYFLCFLNEAILLLNSDKKIVSSVPDRILLLDLKKEQGVSTLNLEEGKEFCIVVISAEQSWQTKEAQKLFGSNRFTFFYNYL